MAQPSPILSLDDSLSKCQQKTLFKFELMSDKLEKVFGAASLTAIPKEEVNSDV